MKYFLYALLAIALLLVALFNLFQNNAAGTRGRNEIPYSKMLADVESGQIAKVEIRGHRITGEYRDNSGQFTSIAMMRLLSAATSASLAAVEGRSSAGIASGGGLSASREAVR